MEEAPLIRAAGAIAKQNLSANVNAVAVEWCAERAELKLFYYFDLAPSETDLELQKLSMCELVAEFSDIRISKCQSSVLQLNKLRAKSEGNWVYMRGA